VTVRTYWAWETTAALRLLGGPRVAHGGGEGRGISCRHAHSMLYSVCCTSTNTFCFLGPNKLHPSLLPPPSGLCDRSRLFVVCLFCMSALRYIRVHGHDQFWRDRETVLYLFTCSAYKTRFIAFDNGEGSVFITVCRCPRLSVCIG